MIETTKPLKTRDGKEVAIYTDQHKGEYPIVGAIEGSSYVLFWSAEGSYIRGNEDSRDLIQEPFNEEILEEIREEWLHEKHGTTMSFIDWMKRNFKAPEKL